MAPAELKRWHDEHGGPAGTEGPDANGVTTHRARDGWRVNIGPDGTLRMRGFAPPTEDGAPETPAGGTPTPARGGGMDQEAIDRRLAEIGGGRWPSRRGRREDG